MKGLCVLLVALWKAQRVSSSSDPYLYAIYYGSLECSDAPGVLRGYASNQPFTARGNIPANATGDPGEDCARSMICMINATSEACLANEFVREGTATFSIADDGQIFECDSTNPGLECDFLDSCYNSSTFPECQFQVATTSDLVKTPSLVQASSSSDAYDLSSYLIYYSDDACTQLEGIDGVVNGETNTLAVTNENVTCRDAMACAFHPEEGLNEACLKVLEGADLELKELHLAPIILEGEGEAVVCDAPAHENRNCEQVPSTVCQKSLIHPSCHYRLATAATLFSNPQDFLTDYQLEADADIPPVAMDEGTNSNETLAPKSGAHSYAMVSIVLPLILMVAPIAFQ